MDIRIWEALNNEITFFFDTETTGVKPGSICQLSYILVDTSTKPQKTIGKNIFLQLMKWNQKLKESMVFFREII